MQDSGIEWLGEIPTHWKVARLKNVVEITDGTHDTPFYTDSSNSYPLVTSKCILNGIINLSLAGRISENDYNEINKRSKVNVYDVIMPMIGTVGNPAIVTDDSKFAIKNVALIKTYGNYYLGKFIKYILESSIFLEQYNSLKRSGVQDFISQESLKNIYIPLLPLAEQKKIVDFLDKKCSAIDSAVDAAKKLVENLREYKKSLITETVTKGLNSAAKMQDSGVEWLGDIPAHWKIIKLKYFGTCRNGLTYSPNDIVDEDEGILVLRSSNIKNGKLFFGDNVFVKNADDTFKVKKGDIIICSRNGSRELIGKNALIDIDIEAYFGAFMLIYRCKNPKYIYHVLNSDIFNYYLGTFFTSTINQLTIKNFANIKIPLPPIEEQKEIAAFLDSKCAAIDENISKREKLIEKLSEYKKSLIYEVVTGKVEV